MPWDLPDDRLYFMAQTKKYGGAVLMGFGTFTNLSRSLPDRKNFVVTHQKNLDYRNITIVNDLPEFSANLESDLWVIGGAEIFAQTLSKADELYITEIDYDFGCDKFFPQFEDKFKLVKESELEQQNDLRYIYKVYKKLQ